MSREPLQVVVAQQEKKKSWLDQAAPVAQLATPLVIAAIGALYTWRSDKQHDYATAVEILNQREASELSVRSAAFAGPLAAILVKSGDGRDLDRRILAFETFVYNFHGIINTRNIFADLEDEIEAHHKPDSEEWTSRSAKLQAIARGVSNAQKAMILAAKSSDAVRVACSDMALDATPPTTTARIVTTPVTTATGAGSVARFVATYSQGLFRTISCTLSYPRKHSHVIQIVVKCVGTHRDVQQRCEASSEAGDLSGTSVRVQLSEMGDGQPLESLADDFEVSLFGTPFGDNMTIGDDSGHRIALLLRSIDRKGVSLEIVAFPSELVPPGYRPTIPNVAKLLGGESG